VTLSRGKEGGHDGSCGNCNPATREGPIESLLKRCDVHVRDVEAVGSNHITSTVKAQFIGLAVESP